MEVQALHFLFLETWLGMRDRVIPHPHSLRSSVFSFHSKTPTFFVIKNGSASTSFFIPRNLAGDEGSRDPSSPLASLVCFLVSLENANFLRHKKWKCKHFIFYSSKLGWG